MFNSHWSWGKWGSDFMKVNKPSIEHLELAALTYGVVMWTEKLKDSRFIVYCDNEAVVHVVNNFTSGCKNCMILLRILMLRSLEWNFRIFVKHLKTTKNGEADALSRQYFKRFRQLASVRTIDKEPTPPPSALWPLQKFWLNC